ncbi:MAG: guanylyltransferase, partial [Clostridiales bacterium]|nr:guanylyltransferase [Clostridiales bacterium]
MKFDDLDKKMRTYEQSLDQVILPETYMVARLDGKGFTRLTKDVCKFEAPFDERFRDLMVKVSKRLMDCGFKVVYAYTESDEISLLFDPADDTFGRRVRKFNSVLAGEASACATLELGLPAVFDCRVVPLPTLERVQDYFSWRQEDAHRNSLNSHCYWMLRKEGVSVRAATSQLESKSISYKNELLFTHGINFDKLPSWQKRGIGLYWAEYTKDGFNPITKETVPVLRKKIEIDIELPLRDEYGKMIERLLN